MKAQQRNSLSDKKGENEMTTLQTVTEYARNLAETFGAALTVAKQQTSFTHLLVNTSTGAASLRETIEDDYLPDDPGYISVTKTKHRSALDSCESCEEDDEFSECAENAENWDVNALAEEIEDKLTDAGVTDTSVASWKQQA